MVSIAEANADFSTITRKLVIRSSVIAIRIGYQHEIMRAGRLDSQC